jgi:hypothetical protein
MEVSKVPSSMSHQEPASWKEEIGNDPKTLHKDIDLFKADIEKQINQMGDEHTQEIKRLYLKIKEQTKII